MFKKLIQVGTVTKNLKTTLDNFYNIYNTGPWYVLKFSPENVDEMRLHGKKQDHSMNVGVRFIGDIRFEYMEPITPSIYSEFYDQYGGRIVHHLKLEVNNLKETLDFLKSKNIEVMQSGHQLGVEGKNMYYYVDTSKKLAFITEIVHVTKDFIKPDPDSWYPEKDKNFDFVFKGVSQVGIVVRNVLDKIKDYQEFGIGPWEIREFGPENISNMKILNRKTNYRIKAAFCRLKNIQFKLIQPLDNSIFMDHLNNFGETIHHLKMEVEDYNKTQNYLQSKGVNVIQSGKTQEGFNFSYLGTDKHINFITEISEKNISPKKDLIMHP